MDNNNNQQLPQQEEFDIKNIFKIVRKYLWLFITLPVIAVIIGVVYAKLQVPEYTTSAQLLIKSDGSNNPLNILNMMTGSSNMFGSNGELEDEILVVKSKKLLTQLIIDLDLRTDTYIKKGLTYRIAYQNEPLIAIYPQNFWKELKGGLIIDVKKKSNGTFTFNFVLVENKTKQKFKHITTSLDEPIKTPWGEFSFVEQPNFAPKGEGYKLRIATANIKGRIAALDRAINISRLNKYSNILVFSTVSQSIPRNEAIINKLIEIYNQDKVADQNQASKQMSDFITERLALITDELKDVEKQVENYRKQHKLANIPAQANIFIQSAGEYEKQIASTDIQLSIVNFVENYLKKASNTDLIPTTSEVSNPAFVQAISEYNELVLNYLKAARGGTENNPQIIQIKEKIETMRGNILNSIDNIKRTMEITKNDLTKKSNEYSSKIKDVPTYEREYVEISRQQQIKEQLFLFLLQKREEAQLSLAMSTSSAKVIDSAYTQMQPVSIGTRKIAALALLIGLILAAGIVYLIGFFKDTIENEADLKRFTTLPIIGTLPFEKDVPQIVMTSQKHDILKEKIRMLRTYLPFVLANSESGKTVIITSSISGEGKSFTALNLAISLAMINKKVALVGLDIRKPMLSKYLNISNKYGITNFISDESLTVADIQNLSELNKNLTVFLGGTIPPNPSELLYNTRLDDLFEFLKKNFDYVIVDTAPTRMLPDTYIINRFADAVIYVVRKGFAKYEDIKHINTEQEGHTLNNINLLLNGTDLTNSKYGYNYYAYKQ
ncbi:MAG: polysaccharide biosynthesis tyrosine autokinase [Prevotellaceae bacterium]|nr:polysaccharide biosynthesis tyrosine autokinase [Prevotellaceae bacterium]